MSFNVLYAPNSSGNICNYLSILDVQIPWKNFVGQKLLLPPPPFQDKTCGGGRPHCPHASTASVSVTSNFETGWSAILFFKKTE